jgi:hypothetical protein
MPPRLSHWLRRLVVPARGADAPAADAPAADGPAADAPQPLAAPAGGADMHERGAGMAAPAAPPRQPAPATGAHPQAGLQQAEAAQALQQMLAALPEKEQQRILGLPPDQMTRTLREIVLQRREMTVAAAHPPPELTANALRQRAAVQQQQQQDLEAQRQAAGQHAFMQAQQRVQTPHRRALGPVAVAHALSGGSGAVAPGPQTKRRGKRAKVDYATPMCTNKIPQPPVALPHAHGAGSSGSGVGDGVLPVPPVTLPHAHGAGSSGSGVGDDVLHVPPVALPLRPSAAAPLELACVAAQLTCAQQMAAGRWCALRSSAAAPLACAWQKATWRRRALRPRPAAPLERSCAAATLACARQMAAGRQ